MKFCSRRFGITLPVILLLVACNNTGDEFPQIANPPPFDYADGEALRTGMHQLAFELQRLDLSLMRESDTDPDSQESDADAVSQQQVVSSLRNIERIGGVLRDQDLSSTHTFLREDMTRFLSSVNRAIMEAEGNPPRYYSAGRVSGGCVNCHQLNQ